MDKDYTNRELDEKFNNLSVLIRDKHDDVMVRINEVLVQARSTNGSVASLKMWRAYTAGAVATIAFIGTPVISWTLLQAVSNSSTIAVLNSKVRSLTQK